MGIMPTHKHNCESCKHIKTVNNVDWYHCPKCDGGTLVGRRSDEPSDYWSMTVGIIKRWEDEKYDGTEFCKMAQQIVKENNL